MTNLTQNEIKFVEIIKQIYLSGSKITQKILFDNSYKLSIPNELAKELHELVILSLARNKNIEEIFELYEKQLNVTLRTATSITLQQYSTPLPMSWLVGKFCYNNSENLSVFEPTAGNGLLTVAFPTNNVHVNEIDENRLKVLNAQNYHKVTDYDAIEPFPTEFHKKYDAVIANPPFGKQVLMQNRVAVGNFVISKLEHVICYHALNCMKDNGKAAFIIEGSRMDKFLDFVDTYGNYENGMQRNFYLFLYSHYNVVDIIDCSGKALYYRQSTTQNVRVILIDGRKNVPNFKSLPPKYEYSTDYHVYSYSDFAIRMNLNFQSIKNITELQSIEIKYFMQKYSNLEGEYFPVSVNPTVLNVEVPDSMDTEIQSILKRVDIEVGGVDRYVEYKLKYKSREELYKAFSAEQIDAIAVAVWNIENRKLSLIVGDMTGIGKGRIASGIMRYAHFQGLKPIFVTKRANLFSDIYRDLKDVGMDDLTPQKIAKRDSDGNVLTKEITEYDAETDSYITLTVPQNLTRVIPDYEGKKVFKPFIMNNYASGNDASVTFEGDVIYIEDSNVNLKNEKELVIETGDLTGYDCVLTTYKQFATPRYEPQDKKKKINPIFDSPKHLFFQKISEGNILILDESHDSGGKGATGKFFHRILRKVKGVCFLSATYAKVPENMPIYAINTAIRDAGLSSESFVGAIRNGGYALQEIMSAQLVESGCYFRRERPYLDSYFNYIYFDINGQQKFGVPNKEREHNALFNNITEFLREIASFHKQFVKPVLEEKAKKAADEYSNVDKKEKSLGFKSAPIFSRLFHITSSIILALKAEWLAERAIQRMKKGYKVLLTLDYTMETLLEEIQASSGSTNIPNDFKFYLLKVLNDILSYNFTEAGAKPEKKYLDVKELEEEGILKYNKLFDSINSFEFGISVSPIDFMVDKIKKAGFNVEEITGRKIKLQKNSKGSYDIVKRTKGNIPKIVNNFQNNEIDLIIVNQTGATGISLHAVPDKQIKTFPDKLVTDKSKYPTSLEPRYELKPRAMIVCQPSLDINTMMQMFGRISRTGQRYLPEYDFVSLAVPAEKRLMLMLQNKLKSLNANTTSNQNTTELNINQQDFFNKYGDVITETWLLENMDIAIAIDRPHIKIVRVRTPEGDFEYEEERHIDDLAYRTSGRIALLHTDIQNKFYDEVGEKYAFEMSVRDNDGTNDLKVTFRNLEAKDISKRVFLQGSGTDNPFGKSVYLSECEVNNLDQPLKQDELTQIVKDTLGEKTAEQYKNDLIEEANKYFKERISSDKDAIKEKAEKEIKAIPNSKMAQRFREEFPEDYQRFLQSEIIRIELIRDEEINNSYEKLNSHKSIITYLLESLIVGHSYLWDTQQDYIDEKFNLRKNYVEAVFLGFQIDRNKQNYFNLSNVIMEFALSGTKKFVKLNSTKQSREKYGISEMITTNRGRPLNRRTEPLTNWEHFCKNTEAREKRFFFTGNLLLAYSNEHAKEGELITFNYDDGTIAKGILLKRDFANDSHAAYIFVDIKHLFNYIKKNGLSTNAISVDSEGNETLKENGFTMRDIDGINFEFETKNTKIVKDKEINDLCRYEFKRFNASKPYETAVHIDNLQKLLNVLSQNHNVKVPLTSSEIKKYNIFSEEVEIVHEYKLQKVEADSFALKYQSAAGLGDVGDLESNIADANRQLEFIRKAKGLNIELNKL